MENKQIQHELARKIQQCLSEAGIKADVDLSEHEAVVYAKMQSEGKTLKVVAHITDRDVEPFAYMPVKNEIARARLLNVAIRPTLATQANAGASASPLQVSTRYSQSGKDIQAG